ncbi:ParE toxin of type II toxin-antitoxin system, parDE [uncultured archaeon]|nr:ParE toxin of type II toxin-antitoxin system, parDE [uncultured archaeon]
MSYNVTLAREAARELERLDKAIQAQAIRKMAQLRENPELGKPLGNVMKTKRSIHIGKYRIIYSVLGTTIVIARIAHRKGAYE